jgi:hypothetical protein
MAAPDPCVRVLLLLLLLRLLLLLLLLLLSQDHIAASKELQNSPTFKLLLSVTLGLGNFVNHGSRLAPAGGFRLKTLNKLHDSKTPDNKQTMLQVRRREGERVYVVLP